MTAAGGGKFHQNGWTYLPYKFEADALGALSAFGPHIGRGQRLTDMYVLASALPSGFCDILSEFGFSSTPLRAVGFNKSKEANWSLPWHQDRVVAMPHKTDNSDFKNWSRKSGIWHCEPPAEILAQIAFAYIAFDDISGGSGGLEIAEDTHRYGAIPEAEINARVETSVTACPDMVTGQALLVSALTLHRSAPIKVTANRRALRIDFGTPALNLSN